MMITQEVHQFLLLTGHPHLSLEYWCGYRQRYNNDATQTAHSDTPTYQFEHLRQRIEASGIPNYSLADFISPSEAHADNLYFLNLPL